DQLRQSAPERERIDPVMRVKALVLVGEQKLQKPRIDVLARRRQSPAPFRRGVGPQQLSVAVDHQGGKRKPLPQRRRAEGGDPITGAPPAGDDGGPRRDQARVQPSPQARWAFAPAHRSRGSDQKICRRKRTHFAAVTSIVPVAVRPKRSGRYMSST